jgi:uncharacterized membrane protein
MATDTHTSVFVCVVDRQEKTDSFIGFFLFVVVLLTAIEISMCVFALYTSQQFNRDIVHSSKCKQTNFIARIFN